MIFRPVALPATLPGQLLLTSMPGYREGDVQASLREWNSLRAQQSDDKVTMVCLTSDAEIRAKSPVYAQSLQQGLWAGRRLVHPVPDFGLPPDAEGFHLLVLDLAKRIRTGGTVVIHCAAGIGRTGTAAACVLLALGAPLSAALRQVRTAGSGPETPEQERFVRDFSYSPLLRR